MSKEKICNRCKKTIKKGTTHHIGWKDSCYVLHERSIKPNDEVVN